MIREEKKSSVWGLRAADVVVAGSFLLLVAAFGCGKEEKRVSSATSGAPTASVMATPAATAARGAGTTTAAVTSGVPAAEDGVGEEASSQTPSAEQAITLPPEIVASATDSLVVPGSIVEITAEGSPDVTEVVLSDGRGQSRPFVFDAAANVWRASYRVPLRSTTERLGLSATATNGGSRWKRVWIFLNILPKQTTASVESGDGC